MKSWTKLSLLLTTLTIVGLGSASNAQSIFDKCLQQLSDDDIASAKNSANTIKRLSGITGSNIIKAEECLSGVMGQPYVFSVEKRKFVPLVQVKAAEELAAAKLAEERRIQTNIQAAVLLTVKSCTKLYRKDAEAAILNPVCNDLFLKIGLPD
ncbi:hypothetical protein N9Y41_02200 [Planktomarina temperata]|nr:hypothetical protein [Planktomarina temperata]